MSRAIRALTAPLAAAILGVLLVACSPATTGPSCAWSASAAAVNGGVAFPDLSATYFVLPYALTAGQTIEIRGQYPSARYFSFTTYGLDLDPIDHAADATIAPDAGSQNPFATVLPAGTSGSYSLTIAAGRAPVGHGNALSAGTASTAVGLAVYRVYLPVDASNRAGGQLPSVMIRNADGSTRSIPTCSSGASTNQGATATTRSGLALPIATASPPLFTRQAGASLLPNPDNAYLAAVTTWAPGRVIVVRATAPTFPNTGAGQSPATPSDVRYWSMCTNTDVLPLPVVACAADQDVPLDASGQYTFVVSTPADRPATADAAHGVTWLPWGDTTHPMVLILRNMLASPAFGQAVQDVPVGQAATSVMGPYAPVATVTTPTAFVAP